MAGNYALYRYFDDCDRLLYVGKSGDLVTRDKAHIRTSDWMQFAARSSIERYDTPEEVGDAERKAIQTERPIFNFAYNNTPRAAARLREYLAEAGRFDLMPARLKALLPAPGLVAPQDVWMSPSEDDLLAFVRKILTADSADHAEIRLRALAALEGHVDLPRGRELERLASLARITKSTAYRAKRRALARDTRVM